MDKVGLVGGLRLRVFSSSLGDSVFVGLADDTISVDTTENVVSVRFVGIVLFVILAEFAVFKGVDVARCNGAVNIRSLSVTPWAALGPADTTLSELFDVARCIAAVNMISLSVTTSATARCAEVLVTKVVGVEMFLAAVCRVFAET